MKTTIKLPIFSLIVILAILITGSCEKIKKVAEFDILYNVPEAQFSVDSTIMEAAGNEVIVLERTVRISIDSINRKHNIDKFKNARFDYIRLEIVSPLNANLNWIESLTASVLAPGLNETQVATYSGGENNNNLTIDMVLNDAPITPFILKEVFTLRIYAKVKPPLPAQTITMLLNSRIRITVQPF